MADPVRTASFSAVQRYAQWLLAAVVLLLTGVAAYLAILISDRQQALTRISRYDITWSASQAVNEVARLGHALGAYAVAPGRAAHREVRQRFEIVESRLGILQSGEFAAFVKSEPSLEAEMASLVANVAELGPLIQNADASGSAAQTLDLIASLNGRLAVLASAARNSSGAKVNADHDDLMQLHRIFSGLTFGVLLSGFGLVGWLRIQYGTINKAHREISLRNERFDVALDNMSQGLCMFDRQGRLIVSNRRLAEVLGVPRALLAEGARACDLAVPNKAGALEPLSMRRDAGAGELIAFTSELGSGRVVAVAQQPMPGGGWVATYEDITERTRHEERVAYLASHDNLTGLPNRAAFQTDVNAAMAESLREGAATALLCLDLDRFKTVNDTLGHHVGDLLLVETARRLRITVPDGNTVARLGGDEFSVVLKRVAGREEAGALAARILEGLREPFDLDGHRLAVEASIGIALSPEDSADPEELMKWADIALYQAKNDRRGSFCFFEPGMARQMQARRRYEVDLRAALERDEFVLHFQPIVTLSDPGRVTCYEALVRWNHPVHGMVPPNEFIAVAEETGFIVPLGSWILAEACRQAAAWASDARVAVNLSPVQFKRDDILRRVESALAQSGLPAARLEVEITESVLMEDADRTQAILSALRALGVGIAIDDFGTGFSSLSYLRKFAFSKIKIDRSFVKDIEAAQTRSIATAIVAMGRSLGMTVTAEGVETQEQRQVLAAIGCHEGQGYLFSRPRPGAEFPELRRARGGRNLRNVA